MIILEKILIYKINHNKIQQNNNWYIVINEHFICLVNRRMKINNYIYIYTHTHTHTHTHIYIYVHYHHHHHQCSAQGQVLHCKLGHQGCNSTQTQVFHCKLRNLACSLLGMNRCGTFPLLSAPHSLCSIWTNIKRSEKIPGAPTRR